MKFTTKALAIATLTLLMAACSSELRTPGSRTIDGLYGEWRMSAESLRWLRDTGTAHAVADAHRIVLSPGGQCTFESFASYLRVGLSLARESDYMKHLKSCAWSAEELEVRGLIAMTALGAVRLNLERAPRTENGQLGGSHSAQMVIEERDGDLKLFFWVGSADPDNSNRIYFERRRS